MTDDLTFADLERTAGQQNAAGESDKWPLEEWYDEIRQIPIRRMPVGDLARACRQHVWTAQVVPVVIEALKSNPQAGELYDGELLVALKAVPAEFWAQHAELARAAKVIIERAIPEFEDEVQADAKELLSLLSSANKSSGSN
jgi:hypothetical protein